MSKIGKININIPEKVKVAIAGNVLNIEGPLGKKSLNIDLEMFNLDIKDGKEISIKPKKLNDNSNTLVNLNYPVSNTSSIEVRQSEDSFIVKENILQLTKNEVVVKNVIKNKIKLTVNPNVKIIFE